MSETIKERYRKFQILELPGQPRGMHMGTSYLMNDMWSEINRLHDVLSEIIALDHHNQGPESRATKIARSALNQPETGTDK